MPAPSVGRWGRRENWLSAMNCVVIVQIMKMLVVSGAGLAFGGPSLTALAVQAVPHRSHSEVLLPSMGFPAELGDSCEDTRAISGPGDANKIAG